MARLTGEVRAGKSQGNGEKMGQTTGGRRKTPHQVYLLLGRDKDVRQPEDLERMRDILSLELDKVQQPLLSLVDRTLDYRRLEGRGLDASTLFTALTSLPFGGEKRLVTVTEAGVIDGEALRALSSYLDTPSPSTILVLCAPRPGKMGSLKRKVEKVGMVQEFKLTSPVFEFLDLVVEGKRGPALLRLEALLKEGRPALQLFQLLLRRFRLLYQAAAFRDLRLGGELAAYMSAHPYEAKMVAAQAQGLSSTHLGRGFLLFLEADVELKSGLSQGFALLRLVFRLADLQLAGGQPARGPRRARAAF